MGIGATFLVFALTEAVEVPHTFLLAIGAGAVALMFGPLLPWRTAWHWVYSQAGSGVHGLLESGRNQAAAHASLGAADLLDGLLAEHPEDLWSEPGRWSQHLNERRLIADYNRDVRQGVLDALNRAGDTTSVPPRIMRWARHPRNAVELQQLRDWLRDHADRCSQ